jgi:hypothetical protein
VNASCTMPSPTLAREDPSLEQHHRLELRLPASGRCDISSSAARERAGLRVWLL